MNSFIATITLSAVALLGLANIALLFKSFSVANKLSDRVMLLLACALAVIMCYFLGRAGFVSDERGISGSDVAPFYGTEWYFLIAIGIATLAFQIYILRKHSTKTKTV